MFLDKFLRKCHFRYETGDYQTLVSLLRYNLREGSPKHQKLMALNAEFNALKRNFIHDAVHYSDYKIIEKNIVHPLKNMVDNLQEKDLRRKANAIHREIRFPIFVLSATAETVAENQLLFDLLNFTKKEVIFTTDFQETEAEIVIFDNRKISPEEKLKRIELIIKYINHQKYIVHFGDSWDELLTYPNQIFLVRNKLELNTRLDELVKFIETYRT